MVATAVSEGLIKFRLDHPIAACIELAEVLQAHFNLEYVEVVPGDADTDGLVGIASAAARQVEAHLAAKKPGTGIPAERIADVVGRVLRRDLVADEPLRPDDVGL